MQDKRNFQGGLNRDDDFRVMPDGDYFYAQNIRVLSSEDNNKMLVENVRGTEKETYTQATLGTPGEHKVIGSYEDSSNDCIYYFVWNRGYKHLILEYNANTDTISTVYRDSGISDNNVLQFDKQTLITGVNKIDDLLYWTCDNQYTVNKGIQYDNEPKYINVPKAKAGWATYYNNGSYLSNPRTDYPVDTSYPFEFYAAGDGNYTIVDFKKKLMYIDVCKFKPRPPIYKHQTPIRNISTGAVTPSPNGDITFSEIPANGISYENIPLSTITSTDALDFAYKKNNLFGFVWQFAYRYIYKNNEQGAYTEWSYVLPAPQYGTNMVDEGKQNLYNEIRVWYENGPADVDKIEIVARKCSFIETAPDEGNQGEYYLIATVDNYYYDNSWSEGAQEPLCNEQYGYNYVSSTNNPYLNTLAVNGSSVSYNAEFPCSFIDFRNDGVYTQVDPVAFAKLFDSVPKRAKAQEIIGKNRLAYANYTDGFTQVKPHFEMIPEYGQDVQFTVINPVINNDDTDWFRFGPQDFTSEQLSDYNLSPENYGLVAEMGDNNDSGFSGGFTKPNGYDFSENDFYAAQKTLGWDVDVYQAKVKLTFPTQAQFGQRVRCRFAFTKRFKKDGGNWGGYRFPHSGWNSGWDRYQYDNFGVQIDLEKTVGSGGMQGVVDSLISDIKKICNFDQSDNPVGLPDQRGQNEDPNAANYNPYYEQPIRPFYRKDSNGNQSYALDAETQSAAEMRLVNIQKVNSNFGNGNVIEMFFSPFGQQTGSNDFLPDGDCADNKFPLRNYKMSDGTSTTNLHVWYKPSNDNFRDATQCGACGNFRLPENFDSVGCKPGNLEQRYNAVDLIHPADFSSNANNMAFTYSPGLETDSVWADSDLTNESVCKNIQNIEDASTFKSGAWHRFGLVYYDHKGRSSTVMLNETSDTDKTRSSSVYVAFPSERKFKQQLEGQNFVYTSETLSNAQKLQPADIAWKIYHKPPVWAHYYHWVYARNSSVGQFLQFMVDAAFVNKGAKAGTTQGEADADSKIYLSLNTMDGRPYSYSERNRALVGKWSFAEGDRIRIITNASGTVMTDPDDSSQQIYYDFKISEVGSYPGRFDFDPQANDDEQDGLSGKIKLSPDSPAGGSLNNPQDAKPGKFIILDDPKISGLSINDEVNGSISGWAGVRVEIYRPKKNLNAEQSLYYEFSERFKVINPRTDSRTHEGGLGGVNQVADSSYVDSETTDSTIPATGRFRRGDIWYKPRNISTAAVSLPGQFVESYFLNDFMQTNHNNIGRPHISSPFATELRRPATVTYSDVFQPDTQFNGLHSFNFSQRPYMDYDLTLGSIQKLVTKETDLILMQENKISSLLVNKNIINSPQGDQGLTLSQNVLPEEATPYGGDFGVCKNPESVAVHEKTIYFIDIKRGAALRLGGNGLTVISDYKMGDYFRDKMDLYANILTSEYNTKLDGGLYILGGYDRRHGEYVVTFPPVYTVTAGTTDRQLAFFNSYDRNFNTNSLREDGTTALNFNTNIVNDREKTTQYDEDETEITSDGGRRVSISNKPETLSFNENANRWHSFFTFYPDYYGTLNRTFISFKNGDLYKHDSNSDKHNMFYDNPYPEESKIRFPFNSNVSDVKSWNAITIEGSDKKEIIPLFAVDTTEDAFITVTTDSAVITGSNVKFRANDIVVGDSIKVDDNGTIRTIGKVVELTSGTQLTCTASEINAFLTASSFSSGDNIFNAFVETEKPTMYKTDFVTNLNSSSLTHRTSYINSDDFSTEALYTAGNWVTREEVAASHIPFGITNTVGGEYFGLGTCSTTTLGALVLGANAQFTTSGLNPGDEIFYSDGVNPEVSVGFISSITSDQTLTLVSNASVALSEKFLYGKKQGHIEGDRLKGHYMDTQLTKRTLEKIHLYAVNASVINSELTNK